MMPRDEHGDCSRMHLFWCGAAAGVVGQTIAYPLDVVRRRMQVYGWAGSGDLHYTHNYHRGTFIDAIRIIKHEEGYRGLYRGIGQLETQYAAAAVPLRCDGFGSP